MTNDHDPLCPSTDPTEREYCALCHCDLIAKARKDMLAKAIAAVETVHSPIRIDDDLFYCRGCADAAYEEYSFAWPCAVVTAVHALQANP